MPCRAVSRGCLPSSPPQRRQSSGPAPAPLPVRQCGARQLGSVAVLRLPHPVHEGEGSGHRIGLNGGKLCLFILWARCGSGPLLLLGWLEALSAGESFARPRAGDSWAEEPGAAALVPPGCLRAGELCLQDPAAAGSHRALSA